MGQGGSTIRVEDASGPARLDQARELLRGFAAEWAPLVARIFEVQGFEAEVAGLPGRYAPPSGCLLLAIDGDEQPVGCVALRDLGEGTCEMKRLYVPPSCRGRGAGRLLVDEVVRRAAGMGYRRMVLDSLPEMAGALALYRGRGFVDAAPYWGHPTDHAVFMELSLGGEVGG